MYILLNLLSLQIQFYLRFLSIAGRCSKWGRLQFPKGSPGNERGPNSCVNSKRAPESSSICSPRGEKHCSWLEVSLQVNAASSVHLRLFKRTFVPQETLAVVSSPSSCCCDSWCCSIFSPFCWSLDSSWSPASSSALMSLTTSPVMSRQHHSVVSLGGGGTWLWHFMSSWFFLSPHEGAS